MSDAMYSRKPYLLRAMLDWVVDNNKTPYVLIDATIENVAVPTQYVNNGEIVLNISALAVDNLQLTNRYLSFHASFGQIPHDIYVPLQAIRAIYAHENGQGMAFDESDDEGELPPDNTPTDGPSSQKNKRPFLKIVK